MLLAQKGYVSGAKGVRYWRKKKNQPRNANGTALHFFSVLSVLSVLLASHARTLQAGGHAKIYIDPTG